ncbi:MAG: glycosyltransferase family 39 protein [Candidatus Zixiibacteriota bacterium]|nr:MAG: glycosyltransferase family 39 protein [candidate division Zixibacteria bacterium]
MTERQTTFTHLIILGIAALILRVAYLLLAADHLGWESFVHYVPDTRLYQAIAQHILSYHPLGGFGLLRVGPGYAILLVGLELIFGQNPIWPILFNVLMGALAPVFIYLLAYYLLKSRLVAFTAGTISALSLTSIALSCHILTDQPFFTFHAAALVCFVLGFKTGKSRWFILAGLMAGFAAYIRQSGQMWWPVFLFVPLVVPLQRYFSTRLEMLKRAGLAGAIMLLMIFGWCARNYATDGLFIFGTNGVLTARSCLVAQITAAQIEDGDLVEFRKKWEAEDGDRTEEYAAAYDRAKARIIQAVRTHPGLMFRTYFRNVQENLKVPNYFAIRQVPLIRGIVKAVNDAVWHWLGHTLLVVTLAGLVVLIIRKNHLAWILLALTYAYFTLILGASFWQGSRLHYSAEMAWAILVPYAVYFGISQIGRLLTGLIAHARLLAREGRIRDWLARKRTS